MISGEEGVADMQGFEEEEDHSDLSGHINTNLFA